MASYFWNKIGHGKGFQFDNMYWDNPQVYESVSLYQIGDLCCEKGLLLDPHEQLCYEISYIVSGKGKYMTDGKWYSVGAGDIYVNLPGQVHSIKADEIDPFRYFYLGFQFNFHPGVQSPLQHIRKMFDHIKHPVAKDKFNIHLPFLGAFSEISKATEYSDVMIKTYINQILVYVYRSFYDSWKDEYGVMAHKDNIQQIIYQIINYIDTNICNVNGLHHIANELGYTYSYLSNIFSEAMGFTLQQYYNKKKFEAAVQFLKEGQFSITQISEKLHYQSIHSFSKAFRKALGMSPAQYQGLYSTKQKNKAKV